MPVDNLLSGYLDDPDQLRTCSSLKKLNFVGNDAGKSGNANALERAMTDRDRWAAFIHVVLILATPFPVAVLRQGGLNQHSIDTGRSESKELQVTIAFAAVAAEWERDRDINSCVKSAK